jgi:hypothetical protein
MMGKQNLRFSILITLGILFFLTTSMTNLAGCGTEEEENPILFPSVNTGPVDGVDDDDDDDDDNFPSFLNEADFSGELPEEFPDDIAPNTFRIDKVSYFSHQYAAGELNLAVFTYTGDREILYDPAQFYCINTNLDCSSIATLYNSDDSWWFKLLYIKVNYEDYIEPIVLDRTYISGLTAEDYFRTEQYYLHNFRIVIPNMFEEILNSLDEGDTYTSNDELLVSSISLAEFGSDSSRLVAANPGFENQEVKIRFFWDENTKLDELGSECTYDIKLSIIATGDATGSMWYTDLSQNTTLKRLFFQATGRFEKTLSYSGGCPDHPIAFPD